MITKDTYCLFCKHGSDLLWVDDPLRFSRPKGTNEETDYYFIILSRVDESLDLFYNDSYNDRFKKAFKAVINEYKHLIAPEVFNIMENKYKNEH